VLIIQSDTPVFRLETPLGEVDFIKKDQLPLLCLGTIKVYNTVAAAIVKVQLNVFRFILLLSYFLSLDSVLQVKPTEWIHGNAFVGEHAVKEHSPLLQCLTRPKLKGIFVCEEIDMLLFQFLYHLFCSWLLYLQQSLTAEVLDCAIGDAKSLRYRPIGTVLEAFLCWLLSPIS